MNAWQSLQNEYEKYFVFKPEIWQIRLWYFGAGSPGTKQKRIQHKQYVEHAVGSWDVVIKLAFRYTAKQIAKKTKRWSDKEIASYIYWLLWSPYDQYTTVKIKGQETEMPTFWNYAVENRKSIQPVISQRGVKNLKAIFKTMADKL